MFSHSFIILSIQFTSLTNNDTVYSWIRIICIFQLLGLTQFPQNDQKLQLKLPASVSISFSQLRFQLDLHQRYIFAIKWNWEIERFTDFQITRSTIEAKYETGVKIESVDYTTQRYNDLITVCEICTSKLKYSIGSVFN